MSSVYEQNREARIKENMERMQQLGLEDLSLKLRSLAPPPNRRSRKNPSLSHHNNPTPLPPPGPVRRSSRLQNSTPVSYSEVVLAKKDECLEFGDVRLEEGSKPEVYTEEHEKMLGNTERSWTFFVDGYGKDGKRIYDPIKGKTCHQCRQKTLGHRTTCSQCNIVQGQFCGDCLYMRYGEHVLEAIENPNWICPVCRGICNCSLCRHAKGWPATGSLYRQISNMGFKSVAHYLIQTRRAKTNSEKNPDTINQVSAKRSLSFTDMEALSRESPQVDDNQLGPSKSQFEDKGDHDYESEKENKIQNSPNAVTDNQFSAKRSLLFSNIEAQSNNMESAEVDLEFHAHYGLSKPQLEDKRDDEFKCEKDKELNVMDKEQTDSNINMESAKVDLEVHDQLGLSKPQYEDKRDEEFQGEEEKELHFTDTEQINSTIALESCQKLQKKRALATEPSLESVAGRLRQRRRTGNEKNSDVVNDIMSEKEVVKEKEMLSTDKKHGDSNIVLERSPKPKKKPARAPEPSPNSVAGRLRQRRDSVARRLRPRRNAT